MQETEALIRSVLHGHMSAREPLRQYLLHRFWEPVLEACCNLTTTCSSPSLRPEQDHHQLIEHDVSHEGSISTHMDDIGMALDGVNAAGLQAAQVRDSTTDTLFAHRCLQDGCSSRMAHAVPAQPHTIALRLLRNVRQQHAGSKLHCQQPHGHPIPFIHMHGSFCLPATDSLHVSGMQAAYSLVHAAQQAAPESSEARWLVQQLNRLQHPASFSETCRRLEALDLARPVQPGKST